MSLRSALGVRFAVEELEPRVTPADASFAVPGEAGPAQLRFEWGAGGADYRNEVGFYVVDDASGRVNGLLPSDPGYAAEALARARVVFASGSRPGAVADVSVTGGEVLGLYLVSNNTTAAARAGQATALFSFSDANPGRFEQVRLRERGDGGRDFRFEDQPGGGDWDFNDAVIAVKPTSAVATPGQVGQTVQATFSRLESDTNLRGEFGLYQVDGADGRIGSLRPGDPGYAEAALTSATRAAIFTTDTPAVATQTANLFAGRLYGFYYVAGGSAEQLAFADPDNTGSHGLRAYFSFVDANPDRLDHLDWRSPDMFGLEDTLGGGDQDFNDSVIRFRFDTPVDPAPTDPDPTDPAPTDPDPTDPAPTDPTPTDPDPTDPDPTDPTPTDPTPPSPPPPPVDTTAPVATFRLTSDTGASNADQITSNLQTVVTVTDNASAITALRAGFDSSDAATYVDILPNLATDGTVTLTPALATQVNRGNPLGNGQRTLFVEATDAAGNRSVSQFAFTLDTIAPAAPTFDLATASDSGPAGDLRTDQASVTLTGTAAAGTTVELSRTTAPGTPGSGAVIASATVAANGTFSFANVALNVGPNSFVVRAVDTAGNIGGTFAQTFVRNTPPTVAAAIADQTATAGGADLVFNNLDAVFADAERVLRFVTAYPNGQTGNLDIHLFATQTPATVTNILNYVNSGNAAQDLNGSIFHRLDKGFVLQGGGFSFDPAGTNTATTFPNIPEFAAVTNEPGVSNTRGTVAMAKLGGDPNSATSEFFFNLADNSTNLDTQNGGFTVFGQVMNGGQQTVDAIEATMTELTGGGLPGAPPFPIRAGADLTGFPLNVVATDLAVITTAAELTAAQRMTFSATSSLPGVATAAVAGNTLTIDPLAVGTTTITVTATDLDGSATSFQFTVTVS